jgi:hypothetical protein
MHEKTATTEGAMRITGFHSVRWSVWGFLAAAAFCCPMRSSPQTSPNISSANDAKQRPYVIEYYYKTKWGHADEFIALFRRNHYPVLKKEMELGRILKVTGMSPRYHATEDGRWDYRITIVFKNAEVANDNFDSAALLKQLFPDQETYKREEQRRFEILDAHWDLPIKDLDLDSH